MTHNYSPPEPASPTTTRPDESTAPILFYSERLAVPRAWWVIAGLFGVAMALVFLPVGPLAALLALVAGGVLACLWVSSQGSTRIRITGEILAVGPARIPLTALGRGQALVGDEARAWRTHKVDLRALTIERTFIATAVRIEITDPNDPTPYVYLSTRTPGLLLKALTTARD